MRNLAVKILKLLSTGNNQTHGYYAPLNDVFFRFKTGVKLAESLRSHQILADSKLAQLRSEHSKLSGSLEDGFNVSTRISGDQNRPVSTGERDVSTSY